MFVAGCVQLLSDIFYISLSPSSPQLYPLSTTLLNLVESTREKLHSNSRILVPSFPTSLHYRMKYAEIKIYSKNVQQAGTNQHYPEVLQEHIDYAHA